MNETLKGIAYVGVWVLLWGAVASLADFVLLEHGVYDASTAGQAEGVGVFWTRAIVNL